MNEFPMMFPCPQEEFWDRMTKVVEKVMEAKLMAQNNPKITDHLPDKALLKASEVCKIFQISKPTLYGWMKEDRLKSFKIRSRRYFSRTDIEGVIHQNPAKS
ncbi:MAG: helix-turn-helix domain-containing protein [Sediminibacterium sp.]